MHGYESWTIKKAERWRIDAFELRCWRRLLRVPWTARRSNQSILKEISSGCSLEELTLKLKLQYFVHLMRRVDSLEKSLMLAGIEGRRRRGWERMRWLDGSLIRWTWVWVTPGISDGQGSLACCESWDREESDMTEQLNWTELILYWDPYAPSHMEPWTCSLLPWIFLFWTFYQKWSMYYAVFCE